MTQSEDDSLDRFRAVGFAILTAAATAFATELARWAAEELKARYRRAGDE